VDSLPWIGGEPLFLIMIGNSDVDHIIIEDRGCHVLRPAFQKKGAKPFICWP